MRFRKVLGYTLFLLTLSAFPLVLIVEGKELNGGAVVVGFGFLIYVIVCAIVLRSWTIWGAIAGMFAGPFANPLHINIEERVVCVIIGAVLGLFFQAIVRHHQSEITDEAKREVNTRSSA